MSEHDECESERQAVEEARQELQNQLDNPLGWDTEGENYQRELSERRRAVAEAESLLRECMGDDA